mmetsp:Transcript_9529/g.20021  ORF Transcript_9529/g.20021 Transcript_9529/m.20021 type:complete len:327 (+) Transcript_9529:229-1209(+)
MISFHSMRCLHRIHTWYLHFLDIVTAASSHIQQRASSSALITTPAIIPQKPMEEKPPKRQHRQRIENKIGIRLRQPTSRRLAQGIDPIQHPPHGVAPQRQRHHQNGHGHPRLARDGDGSRGGAFQGVFVEEGPGEIAGEDPASGDGDECEARVSDGRCVRGRDGGGVDEPVWEFSDVGEVVPDGEGGGGLGVGGGGDYGFGEVDGGGLEVELVDDVVEVGVDEEGDDVAGEGQVVFGQGREDLFLEFGDLGGDFFEEQFRRGEEVVFVGDGRHLERWFHAGFFPRQCAIFGRRRYSRSEIGWTVKSDCRVIIAQASPRGIRFHGRQ